MPKMHQKSRVSGSGSVQDREVEKVDQGLNIDCLPFDSNTAQYERDNWGLGSRVVDEHSYVEFVPPISRPDVYEKTLIGHSHESDIDPYSELAGDREDVLAGEQVIQRVDYKADKLLEEQVPEPTIARVKPSEKYLFNAQKGTGAKIIPPSPADPRKRTSRSK